MFVAPFPLFLGGGGGGGGGVLSIFRLCGWHLSALPLGCGKCSRFFAVVSLVGCVACAWDVG